MFLFPSLLLVALQKLNFYHYEKYEKCTTYLRPTSDYSISMDEYIKKKTKRTRLVIKEMNDIKNKGNLLHAYFFLLVTFQFCVSVYNFYTFYENINTYVTGVTSRLRAFLFVVNKFFFKLMCLNKQVLK